MDANKAVCYLADIKNAQWQALYEKFKAGLEPARVDRIDKCDNEKTKKLLVCTGVLLQGVLRTQGVSAADIDYSENGKPFIRGREDIFFNISHSGNMVLIALAGQEIGVDIQKPVPYKEALVNKICSMEERGTVEKDLVAHLNFIWAVKESYTKLTGDGISKDMKEVTYTKNDDGIVVYDQGNQAAIAANLYSDDLYEAVLTSREALTVDNVIRMNL